MSAADPIAPGDTVAGKYLVERFIGEGGMGVVAVARHTITRERVALKLLKPEALTHEGAVQRFINEARAAVRIKSEHVARVIDVDRLPNGVPYIVLEYLQGLDLYDLITRDGPLSPNAAASYVLQACEALAEAHVLGIVHRDLKPQNLFLTARADGSPLVKVLDFGISRFLEVTTDPENQFRTQGLVGSPHYMSPEQLMGAGANERSDIWALGVVLYQLVSGHLPFQAPTLPALFVQIMQQEPPPIERVVADCPPKLAAVIRRCMRKEPAHRFPDVGALAFGLAAIAGGGSRVSAERIGGVLTRGGRLPSAAELDDADTETAPHLSGGSAPGGEVEPATMVFPLAVPGVPNTGGPVGAASAGQRARGLPRTALVAAGVTTLAGALAVGWYVTRGSGGSIPEGPGAAVRVQTAASIARDPAPAVSASAEAAGSAHVVAPASTAALSGPPLGASASPPPSPTTKRSGALPSSKPPPGTDPARKKPAGPTEFGDTKD